MRISLTKSKDGFLLALSPAILELIGIDPSKPLEVTTDGRRLIVSQPAQSTGTERVQLPQEDGQHMGRRGGCLEACAAFLRNMPHGAKPAEIAKEIVRRGWWTTSGKTPDQTVSALLSAEVKRLGAGSRFVRIAPNTYALNPNASENQP